MRELTHSEFNVISGGFNCIDPNTFQRMQDKAISDGIVFSVIVSGLIGAGVFIATTNPIAAVITGVAVAPYAAGFGYFNSSTWTTFYA